MALRRVSLHLADMTQYAGQMSPTTSPKVSAAPLGGTPTARRVVLHLADEVSASKMISDAANGDPLTMWQNFYGGAGPGAAAAANTPGLDGTPHAAVPTNSGDEEGGVPGAVHADVVHAEQIIAFYVHLYTGASPQAA